jgi:hypothetical protein
MNDANDIFAGPTLSLVITRTEALGAPSFQWDLTMSAADAAGARRLGYRASGLMTGPVFSFASGPQVRDEFRDVWTTMNPQDRPDIREKMRSLVIGAAKNLT